VPETVVRRCLWCKKLFEARKIDVKRGRGNFDTRGCKVEYQHAHGGRTPTQKYKQEKATSMIRKAFEQDESFADYDLTCLEEDA
jgi:hypothetical protein